MVDLQLIIQIWSADIKTRELSILSCWDWGELNAKKALPTDFTFDFDKHSTILKPKGYYVGVTDFDKETNPDTDFIDSSDEENQHNDDEIQNEDALSGFEDMIDSSGSTDTERSITITITKHLFYD